MGQAKSRGTFAERRANPKGYGYRTGQAGELDVAATSKITRQMKRRFGFPTGPQLSHTIHV